MADQLDWDDDEDDEPPGPVYSEEVDFYVFDIGPGWAALEAWIGPLGGEYGFSLIWDPLDDIRQFERDLSEGRVAHITLRGEPGGFEVVAEPDEPEGWVRVRIWLIDHKDDKELDLEAFCPAAAMAESLRTKTGFLAAEQQAADQTEDAPRTLWQKFKRWLAGSNSE